MTTFVEWLATELETRAWSMSELGRRAGVSHSLVSEILAEKRDPTCDFVVAVARAFGEDPAAVLRLSEHLPRDPPATAMDDALLRAFRRLTQPQQVAITRIVMDLAGIQARMEGGQGDALSPQDSAGSEMTANPEQDIRQATQEALDTLWKRFPKQNRGRRILDAAIEWTLAQERQSQGE